jgi:hypothetical protein
MGRRAGFLISDLSSSGLGSGFRRYYRVGTCANLHLCSHFKIARDLRVPATSSPQKIFRRYIRMCRYNIKGKKHDQTQFTTTVQRKIRGIVELPVSKCPDLADLVCITKIRVNETLELTFRAFHVIFEGMV